MIIDKLGESTILVSLRREDMESYSLDFGSDNVEKVRTALMKLMGRIGEECGLRHAENSYLIEALPGGDCCLLIISVRRQKKRRIYRVKRRKLTECCVIESADDLLDYIARGSEICCEIYRSGSGYYLMPSRPLTTEERAELSEYGALGELDPVAAARMKEFGEPVYARPAPHSVRIAGVRRKRQ